MDNWGYNPTECGATIPFRTGDGRKVGDWPIGIGASSPLIGPIKRGLPCHHLKQP